MTTAAHVIGALLRFLFAVVRLVVTLAVHEQMPALVVFVILAALVLFCRMARPGTARAGAGSGRSASACGCGSAPVRASRRCPSYGCGGAGWPRCRTAPGPARG